jgi:hypothetical protein
VPKASKEDTLKVKIQARALYETGEYTQEQICEIIKKSGGKLSRKTLIKWIKQDPNDMWQVMGKPNEKQLEKIQQVKAEVIPPIVDKIIQLIPEINNETKEQETLQNNIPQKNNKSDIYINEAEANELRKDTKRKNELIKILTEGFCNNAEIMVYETAYLGIQRIRELLLDHKMYYEGKEEKVGYQVAKHLEQLANSAYKYAEILNCLSRMPKKMTQNNFNINTSNEETQKIVFVSKQDELDANNHINNIINDTQ